MRRPATVTRTARSPLRTKSVAGSRVSDGASLPSPVKGWDAISPLASMPADRAVVLDNWFPQPGYIEVRRGHKVHVGALPASPVESLLVYNGLTTVTSKLFAVVGGGIYDVSSSGAAPAASVTSLSSNRWQYVNYTNSSGTHFLWACSGSDAPQIFNGSAWSNPTITGITSSDIINVNVHKNRLWFCLRDSMKAAYLPTDSIQGAATVFNLGSIMWKGGYLVSMATWTHDAGSGPDDYAVFMSSRGQAAVYAGTDPSSANTWSLVGVYDLGAPLGFRCFTKVAGDLALINLEGVLPFSIARAADRGAAAAIAITANINNAMNLAARSYAGNFGWELCPYSKGTRAILNVPIQEGSLQHQYVMNTITGAWCRFTGMNANCWAVFKDNLYFGGNSTFVYQADIGSVDVTQQVSAQGQAAYNYLRSRGNIKQAKMIQPLLTTDSSVSPSIGISTDFRDNAVLGTPSSASTPAALYDSAVYDVDIYPVESRNVSDWTTVSGVGQALSVHFRARTGPLYNSAVWGVSDWGSDAWSASTSGDVTMQLNGFNLIYEMGEFL